MQYRGVFKVKWWLVRSEKKNFRQEAVFKFSLEEWINNSQVDKGVRAFQNTV